MEIVQLTLKKEVYTDPEGLQHALEKVQSVGQFLSLDTRFASRLGVLSGELPQERIADVENLDVVSALQRNEQMSALGCEHCRSSLVLA